MFLHITKANYIKDYKVAVCFNNGKQGVADLSDVLTGGIFEPLKDKAIFANLRVDKELATLVWENGADIAPEYIYFQVFKQERALQSQFRQWGYLT